jgi:dienelactone hydrolase
MFMKRLYIMLLLLAVAFNAAAGGNFVTYKAGGAEYEGYYTSPRKSEALVILVHDWDGLTDYEVKRAEMLKKEGYAVFAIDLFGKGNRPVETDEKRALTGALYGDRAKMRMLLNAGLKAAEKEYGKSGPVIAAGYCFGGAAVLELARSGISLEGFVTFHGGLTTPDGQDYSQTKGRLLILHGTADASVSMDDFAGLARELEENTIAHEMITYSGAPHAFTVFDSPRYRKDADTKSWERFLDFLKEVR